MGLNKNGFVWGDVVSDQLRTRTRTVGVKRRAKQPSKLVLTTLHLALTSSKPLSDLNHVQPIYTRRTHYYDQQTCKREWKPRLHCVWRQQLRFIWFRESHFGSQSATAALFWPPDKLTSQFGAKPPQMQQNTPQIYGRCALFYSFVYHIESKVVDAMWFFLFFACMLVMCVSTSGKLSHRVESK